VNKRSHTGFVVERIEQYRRDTLRDDLSPWLE